MIKLLIGEKGTGKTKAMLDSVQAALDRDHGSVVFINNNKRHVLDLNYKIRMVDTSEFSITNFEELYGLICGIISQNFDITDMFLDSITKIALDVTLPAAVISSFLSFEKNNSLYILMLLGLVFNFFMLFLGFIFSLKKELFFF